MLPTVTPQLLGNRLETRNRRRIARDWLRGDAFEAGLRRLADRLPILWHGTILDSELTAGLFAGTMAALHGSKRFQPELRYVVFDVPFLAGVDLRRLPWIERRERLELLAQAFDGRSNASRSSIRRRASPARSSTAALEASS